MRQAMSRTHVLALALLAGTAVAAWSVPLLAAGKPPALDLDAGPESSTPDPLAPPDVSGPAPVAPGAPVDVPMAKPGDAVDPIVLALRQAQPPKADKEDVAALVDFYANAAKPIFIEGASFNARAKLALEEIAKADDWGLKASAFDLPKAPAEGASPDVLAQAEMKLAVAVLTYARHARGGRFDPTSISRLFDQKPSIYDPKSLIRAVAVNDQLDAYLRDLHPKHAGFHNLRKALLAARGVKSDEAASPPSEPVPSGPSIRPGTEHPHVALVRKRLAIEAGDGKETVLDEALVAALKTFQKQRGLEANGVINGATRNALNDQGQKPSKSDDVRRILANMERWRWLPADLGEFYVWDSVPEQMTTVYENGKQVLSERIVVGKTSSPTVIFSADMQFVIFHPSWGVPPGMKANELGPQLRNTGGGWFSSNPLASQVLAAHGLKVSRGGVPVDPDSIDWSTANIGSYDFVQPPGPRNVLGMVKFRFPNKHDIYMHDTPERHLFGGSVRAFSHGCMRVQNPVKLAEVILAYDKGYDAAKTADFAKRGGEIKLSKRVPVHITYFTAVADEDGSVKHFADLYGLDARVASAMEGQQVRVAGVAPPTASIPEEKAERAERPKKGERVARKKGQKDEGFNPFGSLFGGF